MTCQEALEYALFQSIVFSLPKLSRDRYTRQAVVSSLMPSLFHGLQATFATYLIDLESMDRGWIMLQSIASEAQGSLLRWGTKEY